jgi:cytochrome oxidase Cu insertion factor (SCO1/SenC/PrrC family)
MNKAIAYFLAALVVVLVLATGSARAALEIGKPAPEITATDIKGQPFKLSDHKGKVVVLEWSNHECPFVVKHYGSGNMQKTPKSRKRCGR